MRTFDAESIEWKSLKWKEGLTSAKAPCSEVNCSPVLLQHKHLDQVLRLLSERERTILGELSASQQIVGRLLATTLDDQVLLTPKIKVGSRILKSFCLLSEECDSSYLHIRQEVLCSVVHSRPFLALNFHVKELFLNLFDISPISFKHELMHFFLNRDYYFGRFLNAPRDDHSSVLRCLYDSFSEVQKFNYESCWLQLAPLLLQHVAEVIEGPATEGRKRVSIRILANLFLTILQEQLRSSRELSNK